MDAISPTAIPACASSADGERRAALAALYRVHAPSLFGYAYRRTGDAHLAEDVTSDVFVRAFERLDSLEPGPRSQAWLFRVASNLLDRRARRRRLLGWLFGEEHFAQVPAQETAEGDDGEKLRVRAALLALPPRFQTVLALHYVEGLDVERITAILNCPTGTVHSRLSRGRELLRKALSKESKS